MRLSRLAPALAAAALLASGALAQSASTSTNAGGGILNTNFHEDFETYNIGVGSATNLGITYLDENAIANGQGPGLVLDGAIYACNAGQLQWNGAAYYGQPSRDLLANSGDGQLIIKYDQPVQKMSLTLHAFDGFSDSTVINVYDGNGVLIYTSGAISVPNSAAVPFSHVAASIGSLTIQSTVWPWSTIIDDHKFGGGGPTLTKSGACPGPITLTVMGCTPGGAVAIVHGPAGSYTKPNNPCMGIVLNMSSPTLGAVIGANGAGNASLSFNAPPAACGRTVQAVDVSSCTPSNSIVL